LEDKMENTMQKNAVIDKDYGIKKIPTTCDR
jgi:hypothetical protein